MTIDKLEKFLNVSDFKQVKIYDVKIKKLINKYEITTKVIYQDKILKELCNMKYILDKHNIFCGMIQLIYNQILHARCFINLKGRYSLWIESIIAINNTTFEDDSDEDWK